MKRWLAAFCSAVCLAQAAEPYYPPLYPGGALFRNAIRLAEAEKEAPEVRVTGLTVPHHLLAADMIASAMRMAAKGSYKRIIILSPDHFGRSKTAAATTVRPFHTPLGDVPVDEAAVAQLLADPLFSSSTLFSHEHGVQALVPFLAHYFPGAPVVPVTVGIRSNRRQWAGVCAALEPLAGPGTLIIQSTDFSHYLKQPEAARRDQETLRALCSGDPAALFPLRQPAHIDSKAAQWIQMTLQRKTAGCTAPLILDNRNAIRYGGRPDEPETTSYITQLHSPDFIPAAKLPGNAWFFGGDVHFGRHVAALLAKPEKAAELRRKILDVTGGAPLIVNLEGVLLDPAPPVSRHPMRLGMDARTALAELGKLKVRAAVLENNHSHDHGAAARTETIGILTSAGVRPLVAGPAADFGPFRLAVATDLLNRPQPASGLLTAADFTVWREAGPDNKPLFAFLHMGREYADQPGARERELAALAEDAGASLVLGCHPHRPSPGWELSPRALRFHSLGNLIFDQADPANGGGLIEVRFFEQGTWAARWIPLGNLFSPVPPSPESGAAGSRRKLGETRRSLEKLKS